MLVVDCWSSTMWCRTVRDYSFLMYVSSQAFWWEWAHSGTGKAVIVCPKRSWVAICNWIIICCALHVCYPHRVRAWTWTTFYIENFPFPLKVEMWKWYVNLMSLYIFCQSKYTLLKLQYLYFKFIGFCQCESMTLIDNIHTLIEGITFAQSFCMPWHLGIHLVSILL